VIFAAGGVNFLPGLTPFQRLKRLYSIGTFEPASDSKNEVNHADIFRP
jgi:hypothetical protein